MRFSPTGESYASGSEDGTIRIWQTTPPANLEENETTSRRVKQHSSVDEVSKKIEGFHINKEGKTGEKPFDA